MNGRAPTEDVDKALELLDQALMTAETLGMKRLAEQALALRDLIMLTLPTVTPAGGARILSRGSFME